MNSEYEAIINEFIKKYLFYKKNYSKHIYCENCNLDDFKNNLKQLFENSKKSYNITLEKSIINFVLYLQNKLEKINDGFIYKKVNDLIEHKKNEEKKKIDSDLLNKTFFDSINFIEQKMNSFKDQFEEEINLLVEHVERQKNLNEIKEFSLKWKEKKESLENDIKNEISELSLKVNEKIDIYDIDENEFEKQGKIRYFDWKHITAHAIAFSINGGLGIAAITTSIAIPCVGYIIAGGGVLIHLGICGIKYLIDKKKLTNIINSIASYSQSFIDNLNAYKANTKQTLENLRDSVIAQIQDKYSLKSFIFEKEEEEKFKEIIELFQKNIEDNFNLK